MSCVSCLPQNNNFIFNEKPAGNNNCLNVSYTTSKSFDPKTLIIRLDGVTLDPDQYIINTNNNGFDLIVNPNNPKQLNRPLDNSEILRVDYLVKSTNSCISFI